MQGCFSFKSSKKVEKGGKNKGKKVIFSAEKIVTCIWN